MFYLLQISAICAGCVILYTLLHNFLFGNSLQSKAEALVMDCRDWVLFIALVCFDLLFCIQSGRFFRTLFPDDYPASVFSYAVSYQLMMILCIFVFKKMSFAKVRFNFKLNLSILKSTLKALVLALLCSLFLGLITNIIVYIFTFELPKKQEIIDIFMSAKSLWTILLAVFSFVVLAPICEELFFRALVYRIMKGSLEKTLSAKVALNIAAICSAVIFAMAHGNAFAFIPLFVMALILTSLYERTGSILAPMICHSMFNLLSSIMILSTLK